MGAPPLHHSARLVTAQAVLLHALERGSKDARQGLGPAGFDQLLGCHGCGWLAFGALTVSPSQCSRRHGVLFVSLEFKCHHAVDQRACCLEALQNAEGVFDPLVVDGRSGTSTFFRPSRPKLASDGASICSAPSGKASSGSLSL